MPIVLPEDMDVFFDADGFGEPVTYTTPGGAPITTVAIWERGGRVSVSGGQLLLGVDRFTFRADAVTRLVPGAEVLVLSTGETFVLEGEPEMSGDGATFTSAAVPA